jgi:hypothetical protein
MLGSGKSKLPGITPTISAFTQAPLAGAKITYLPATNGECQADAESRAYGELQKELQTGEWLPQESIQSFVVASVFDKFNDDEGDTLTLNLRLLAQGTTLNQEQTNEAMLAALRANVPSGGRLVADSVATRREPASGSATG